MVNIANRGLRGGWAAAAGLIVASLMMGQDSCDATFDYVGSMHSEPGLCDDHAEAFAWDGELIDSGFVDLQVRAGDGTLVIEGGDCGEAAQSCPSGMAKRGAAHVGNGTCDGEASGYAASGVGLDSGWMGLCSTGDVIFAVGVNDCGGAAPGCPSGFAQRGQLHVGSGACDGQPNGWSFEGQSIDSGWLFLCVQNDAGNLDVGDDSCDRL